MHHLHLQLLLLTPPTLSWSPPALRSTTLLLPLSNLRRHPPPRLLRTPTCMCSMVEVAQTSRVGVLLLTMGCPDTLDEVESYFYRMMVDPEKRLVSPILRPLSPVVARAMSYVKRQAMELEEEAERSFQDECALIGGNFEEQARLLQESLQQQGVSAVVRVATQYVQPLICDVLEQMKNERMTGLVVLPLYPHFSLYATGAGLSNLEKIVGQDPELAQLKNTVVPAWYRRHGYVESVAAAVQQKLLQSTGLKTHIIFAAFGLPTKYISQLADPYQEQVQECVSLVMQQLQTSGLTVPHSLTYQCNDPQDVSKLQPYTNGEIQRLAAQGVQSVIVVPVSHIHECLETLLDLDVESRGVAEAAGMKWQRIPAIANSPLLISALRDCVVEALPTLQSEPVLAINDGSPVSLRIVNDLVDVTRKTALSGLAPPELNKRWGFTYAAEVINGRIAMGALASIFFTNYPVILAAWYGFFVSVSAWENLKRTEGLEALQHWIMTIYP